MSIVALLRRLNPARAAEPDPPRAPDRSDLLRELEVAVPAPERIVGWEAARGAQRLSRT